MKQTNKCVFLDRDGTIITNLEYNANIDKIEFLNGAINALKKLQDNGFLLIIVTNQSGVARGYFEEDAVIKFNNVLEEKLKEYGVNVTKTYYCPHLPDGVNKKYAINCNCRKPKLGLFNSAIESYNINLSESYAIGDNPRDVSICLNTNCKGFFIGNYNIDSDNVTTVSSLSQAVSIILGE